MSRYDIANGVKVTKTPKKSVPFKSLYGSQAERKFSKKVTGLSKEQLCLRISDMILGPHSERWVVRDQAVTLMHIPEPELQAMLVRLQNSRGPARIEVGLQRWDDL